ncbi:Acetyltransferase (GNAT) family protein [Roseovarius sp. THAF9]|uniref:GNAT family N-acetyltransferase n=1 Tax=Roseovarius sp. THAF9 TaxID=2587847 RepID=UPI001267B608|nr:GNAT family N-acetyltransferase [Roseovarius sp. THAF9]QFT94888.1 Acetyltransferase (GNAT) family protein [Roseovarius sp. THAF9]
MIETLEYRPELEPDFLLLYRECLSHYGISAATPQQERRVVDLLNDARHVSCLMAFEGDVALGFAIWTLTVPAGAGVALYMKEIFVSESARGKGVGRTLICWLLARAQAAGCVRVDWQTDGSNATSQAFYSSIGAPEHDKKSFRIMAEDFERFRGRISQGC